MSSDTLALEATDISKAFGSVKANDQINLEIKKGKIHALLGENGAGKSTLVNILFGLYKADSGIVKVDGETVDLGRPKDAIDRGIGMVHQHFQLVPVLTVAENIVLGNEPSNKASVIDIENAKVKVKELAEKYQLDVDTEATVEDLPVGTQQRVEILRSLYREANILILDEPTAVLTPQETDHLLQVLKKLASQGVAIIFITHKLREVLEVADEVTVMRNGQVVGSTTPDETDESGLAEMMVGRSVVLRVSKETASPEATVLKVKNLCVQDDRGLLAVNGLSLEVRSGEIFGIAGVEGNGQRELVETITGLRTTDTGEILIGDTSITESSPRQISELGVAHIPEDREKHGLIGAHSVADNLILNRYYKPPFSNRGIRQQKAIANYAKEMVEKFDIRTPSIETPSSSLSGGNKQKAIAAREFSHNAKLLVASQPTRGIDVGSIEFVHQQLISQRDQGLAVLLVSAELDEILSLSDRIGVIYRGQLVVTENATDLTRNRIGRIMTTGSDSN
ncbi:MAG: ABC transporter ATP-binding protein [Acidimicrobiales bacterium]|jgi:simple sugar transport system ATP-binding protein|nr:heme ABC transporter ATP-binding protein [Acidimicrobiaceae bacterium]MDP6162258.1 ABC transporter ATP-binding protein [Acidimicrobiales bacterium]MDP6285338.1 ABC transporter ATP-binding protein [Acidimicrobiales bacterium]HJO41231.1 ABC transporter ATP-binding protein [Acidimicrobiales bacterium]|tara:strand:- start:2869 stop:4395 length:1527 start_codon:yes stop_codon:yes gene_type:complete